MTKSLFIVGVGTLLVGLLVGYGVGESRFVGRNMQDTGIESRLQGKGNLPQKENRSDDGNGKNFSGRGMGENGQQKGDGNGMGMNASSRRSMGDGGGSREHCLSDECLSVDGLEYPAGTLSEDAKKSIARAIDDEYKAFETYNATISSLGSVRPFSMIRRAEEQHISSLRSLFDKYGVAVPVNAWSGKVTSVSSLQSACQAGVAAEKANISLYRNELLPAVKNYPDITRVFENLLSASENRHLLAFEQCD